MCPVGIIVNQIQLIRLSLLKGQLTTMTAPLFYFIHCTLFQSQKQLFCLALGSSFLDGTAYLTNPFQ